MRIRAHDRVSSPKLECSSGQRATRGAQDLARPPAHARVRWPSGRPLRPTLRRGAPWRPVRRAQPAPLLAARTTCAHRRAPPCRLCLPPLTATLLLRAQFRRQRPACERRARGVREASPCGTASNAQRHGRPLHPQPQARLRHQVPPSRAQPGGGRTRRAGFSEKRWAFAEARATRARPQRLTVLSGRALRFRHARTRRAGSTGWLNCPTSWTSSSCRTRRQRLPPRPSRCRPGSCKTPPRCRASRTSASTCSSSARKSFRPSQTSTASARRAPGTPTRGHRWTAPCTTSCSPTTSSTTASTASPVIFAFFHARSLARTQKHAGCMHLCMRACLSCVCGVCGVHVLISCVCGVCGVHVLGTRRTHAPLLSLSPTEAPIDTSCPPSLPFWLAHSFASLSLSRARALSLLCPLSVQASSPHPSSQKT